MKSFLLLAVLVVCPCVLRAQDITIHGTIRDGDGERLYWANVLLLPDSIFTHSDLEGAFTVHTRPGMKEILISYTGFETFKTAVSVLADTALHFVLTPKVGRLREVVIEEDRFSNEDIFESVVSGTQTITRNDLLNMPSFMGEADIMKAVRLLPGATGGMEGTSNLFVRGGAADQNLVLLDGAPIYNPGHLLGFLSVFNPDILEKVDVMHGGFPAEFGGRLSSVLNVGTNSAIAKRTSISADFGLIGSRLKLEQPLISDKASIWIAGRKSYVDKLVQMLSGEPVPYSFHELNGKVIFHPSPSDQIEVSHYNTGDDLDFLRDNNQDGRGMKTTYQADNSSQTFNWRRATPGKWNYDVSMFHTRFAYNTRNAYRKDYQVSAHSDIEDFGSRITFARDSIWGDGEVSAGVEWIRHDISPKVLNSEGSITDVVQSGSSGGKLVHEFAAYVQQEWSLLPRLKVNAGVRASMAATDARRYLFPEPRISVRYALGDERALKFNYSRMVQYLHRISNSAVSTPIDVWFPVTDSIRPQTSHQFALAWQRFMPYKRMYFSVEGYYKSMDDLVSYEEGTNFLFRSDFESRLVQGRGKAYGLEFLMRKERGRFTGWISYSLSWSWRRFDALNGGDWFRARYDRRHNGAVVAQYSIGKRWMASLVWEYISGARFTPVVGQYLALAPNGAGLELIPEFSPINSVKLSDSHRLDLGLKYFSKPGSKFQWNVFIGVYNAYNRATPFGIVIKQNQDDNSLSYSQPGLFGLLPFVSYGCKI